MLQKIEKTNKKLGSSRIFFLYLSAELRQSYFSRYYLESLNILD